jgi:hypothetical protein
MVLMVEILSSGVFDLLPEEQPTSVSSTMRNITISFDFIFANLLNKILMIVVNPKKNNFF